MIYNKTIVFDLDGVLVSDENGSYSTCYPQHDNIKLLKDLYLNNTIVIQTGRAERWKELTEKQLKQFNIPYHLLDIGNKVPADYYIDDKSISIEEIKKNK